MSSIVNMIEDRISELANRSTEFIQREQQRQTKQKKKER